jgi:hypothetical protein
MKKEGSAFKLIEEDAEKEQAYSLHDLELKESMS